jgi:hypothetical protein
MKVKYSFYDKKGLLWVACSECERGGNGNGKDKCSCGGGIKRGGLNGCFSGTLMDKFEWEGK